MISQFFWLSPAQFWSLILDIHILSVLLTHSVNIYSIIQLVFLSLNTRIWIFKLCSVWIKITNRVSSSRLHIHYNLVVLGQSGYITHVFSYPNLVHLCFNITDKGQLIELEWYNRIFFLLENMVKTMFSNENIMKSSFIVV